MAKARSKAKMQKTNKVITCDPLMKKHEADLKERLLARHVRLCRNEMRKVLELLTQLKQLDIDSIMGAVEDIPDYKEGLDEFEGSFEALVDTAEQAIGFVSWCI